MRALEFPSKKFLLLTLILLVLTSFFSAPDKIFAATRTWDGGGGDENWSTCANWDGPDSCPTSSDVATFNSSSTKNATIDASFGGSVSGVNIQSGYTGVITQARTLTVGSGNYAQAAGTFTGSADTITVNGSFSQTGGVFTSTSGTLSILLNMTLTAGTFTHSSGTVAFFDTTFGQDSTLTCSSSPFNLVTITKDQGGGTFFQNDFVLSASCTMPLGAGPTTTFVSTGVPTFTNNGIITVASGTWTQAGFVSFSNNGTVTHSGNGWVFGGGLTNTSSGVVTYSGTTASFTGDLNISSGTFPTGLTVTFGDTGAGQDSTITCSGSPFTQVIITKDQGGITFFENDVTISANCTVPLGASPATVLATTTGLNAALTNNGTITIASGTWAMTGLHTLVNNGTITHNGDGWTTQGAITNGSSGIVTYGGSSITVRWNMNVSSGTFPSDKALTYNDSGGAANATLTCGSVTFSSLAVSKTGPSTLTPGGSCTITGDFSNTAGTIANPSSAYTYTVQGSFSKSASTTFGGANLTLELTGSSDTTMSHSAGTFSAKYKVNKSVGNKVTQTSNLTLGNTFDVTSGTHDQGASFNLTTGGATTVGASGTWTNTGTGDITLAGDVSNSGTITLDGSGVGCGGANDIAITSTGGQRTWSGAGSISPVYDVAVTNQGGSVTAISSTDNGGNGWTFVDSCNTNPNAPTSLGPTAFTDGSVSSDNTPTLIFSLSDSDGSDTVKFQIQIDDTAGFGSVVVDYTSALAAQGSFSFTVGQAAGSGSYTTGSSGQTLSDSSSYYWRVKTIDNSAAESSYSTANGGGVAFGVNIPPGVTFGSSGGKSRSKSPVLEFIPPVFQGPIFSGPQKEEKEKKPKENKTIPTSEPILEIPKVSEEPTLPEEPTSPEEKIIDFNGQVVGSTGGIIGNIFGSIRNATGPIFGFLKNLVSVTVNNSVTKITGGIAATIPIIVSVSVFFAPIASGAPITNHLTYLFIFTAQFIGLRKNSKPWGTVYDQLTKQPISFARVEILNKEGRKLATTVTDFTGRYGFLVSSSILQDSAVRLQAYQDKYVFSTSNHPSDLEKLIYPNIYHGELLENITIANFDLPMEPVERSSRANFYPKILSQNLNSIFAKTVNLLFTVGAIFALAFLSLDPGIVSIVLALAIVLTALLRKSGFRLKPFGLTKDVVKGQEMPFSFLALYDSLGKRVNFTVSDDQGRYFLLVSKGRYQLKANTPAHISPSRSKEIPIVAKEGWVSREVKL